MNEKDNFRYTTYLFKAPKTTKGHVTKPLMPTMEIISITLLEKCFIGINVREIRHCQKVSSNRCICLKTLKMCKIVLKFLPQLGFKLSTIQPQLRFQVQHSMTELYSYLLVFLVFLGSRVV